MGMAMVAAEAPPMTDEEFARAPRKPRAKIVSRALRLTQEEFAARYRTPRRSQPRLLCSASAPPPSA